MGKERVFKTEDLEGNAVTLKFVTPSQDIINKGELKYRESFSQAFRNHVLTEGEVVKCLKERNLWTDKDDEMAAEIRSQLSELEKSLDNPELSNDEGLKVVEQIRALRVEMHEHNSRVTSISENTCESLANSVRNQLYAAECVYNLKTGKKVFKDFDEFRSRLNEKMAVDSFAEVLCATYEDVLGIKISSDFTSHLPENKWVSNRKIDEQTEVESETEEKEEKQKKSKPRGRPRKKKA
jgi:hypothetical protein